MANNKKLVEAITSMEDDFAQWYTDVVKKAESFSIKTGSFFVSVRINTIT